MPNRLRELRNEKGITQQKLADDLCIKRDRIGSWESGKRQPECDSLFSLARYFNVSAAYFIDNEAPLIPDDLVRKTDLDLWIILKQVHERPLLITILRDVICLDDRELDMVSSFIDKTIMKNRWGCNTIL